MGRMYALSLLAVLLGSSPSIVGGEMWEPVPALPTGTQGRVFAFGLVQGGTMYALGGTPWVNGSAIDGDGSVHSFLPGAMSWQTEIGLDGMGPVIGQGGGVDSLGRLIVFGGENVSNGDHGETATYVPGEGPSGGLPRRPNPAPDRYFAWCTDAQGRVYSIGGGKGREAVPGEGNVGLGWRYVPSTNTWDPIAPLPTPVGDAAAVYDGNGHILVIGGVVADGGARSTNVARYDVASNTWSDTAVADLPVGVNGHRAVVGANGWVYVIGGEGGTLLEPSMLDTVWIYRPDLNSWQASPNMAQARRYHGAVLGLDNYIYVFGGENNGGGLVTAERLYTPSCPTVTTQPEGVQAWAGANVGLVVTVAGGNPLSYQWQMDGTPLADGPLGGGTTISGSQTPSLAIENVSLEATGQYSVVVTNSCGSTESTPATVTMLMPPNIDGLWVVTNLHPGWAEQSYATDVEGGRQVGYGIRDIPQYNNIDLACEWSGTPESCTTYSEPGSVGGAFHGRGAGHRVGWWWWPYQCYVGGQWYTCYTRQAALLDATNTFFNLQVSGWEYSSAVTTDGIQVVGTATTDDAVGNYFSAATLWWKNSFGNWTYLQLMWPYDWPGRDSNASAVFAGKQYGSWQYRG
ncbi:MAG: kelch repeat-containing protein, partial [Planctomycetota bacterium]